MTPTREELEEGLAEVLVRAPRVRERRPGASNSELVTLEDGLRVFVKYGVGREAHVYRHLLAPLGLSVPRYVGTVRRGETVWLVLEAVDGRRLHRHPGSLWRAARWLGHFHRVGRELLVRRARKRLPVLDLAHYERSSLQDAQVLLKRPTLLHGDFTPRNILVEGEAVHPLEWGSAAVGAGEVDLARLVEDQAQALREEALTAYSRARWPQGEPEGFPRAMRAAEAYLRLLRR